MKRGLIINCKINIDTSLNQGLFWINYAAEIFVICHIINIIISVK